MLVLADPEGPTCHLGTISCFGGESDGIPGGHEEERPVERRHVRGEWRYACRCAGGDVLIPRLPLAILERTVGRDLGGAELLDLVALGRRRDASGAPDCVSIRRVELQNVDRHVGPLAEEWTSHEDEGAHREHRDGHYDT